MAIRTREEYIESLRKLKPRVYARGEKIENIVDHPAFQGGINAVAASYEIVQDPKYQDLAVVMSPLINERISLWTHILQDQQDAIASVRLAKAMGDYLVPCHYRCVTADVLTAEWASTYDIDKNHNTDYHQRFVEFVKEAQRNDWVIGGSAVNPKGDRSLRPSQQSDPDMYLHIVERKKDGIVVRGAKPHCTAAACVNMLMVESTVPRNEPPEFVKDYTVSFSTPADAEGITLVCRPPQVSPEPEELENPLSSKYGAHVECLVVFDNVFVPWERVWRCGEYEATSSGGPRGGSHAMHKCVCRSCMMDLAIGATALIADYNGVEKAPHIRDYLTEMMANAEITYSCALASALEGWRHESGAYFFKSAPASSGKIYAARKLGEDRFFMQDAAGGLVATMASEKDYKNPKTRELLEKYYQGRQGVPTEHRIRAFKLIEDLTASPFAGWYHAMAISGGFPTQAHKAMIRADYDLEKSKRKAMVAAGIK